MFIPLQRLHFKPCKPLLVECIRIHDIIKPIFTNLAADSLLSKCLPVHGQTQNTNESLDTLVWQRCPKSVFVSREVLEMAVNSAIINYNDGTAGMKNALVSLGIKGTVTSLKTKKHDVARVKRMNRKSSEPVKKRRKTLRSIKKGFQDREMEKGKPSYLKGGF